MKDRPTSTTSDEPRSAPAAVPTAPALLRVTIRDPQGCVVGDRIFATGTTCELPAELAEKLVIEGTRPRVYKTSVCFLTNSRAADTVYDRGTVAAIDPKRASLLIGLGHAIQITPGTTFNPADLPGDPMNPKHPEAGAPLARVRVVSGGNHLAGTRHLPAVGTRSKSPNRKQCGWPPRGEWQSSSRMRSRKPVDAMPSCGRTTLC